MRIRIRRCTGRSIGRPVWAARSSSPGRTGPYTGRCRRLRTVRCTVAGCMGRRMRAVRAASGRRPCTAGPGTARRSAAPAGAAQVSRTAWRCAGRPVAGCMDWLPSWFQSTRRTCIYGAGCGPRWVAPRPNRHAPLRARREPISRPASRSRRRCDAPGWPARPPTRT